ncbi:NfeD family protein, partial [Nocardioides sp. NPDC126508]
AQGQVELDGGLWRARMEFGYDDSVPAVGESVVVEQVRGLTLKVRRREPWELPL